MTAPPTNARHQSAYGVKLLSGTGLSSWVDPQRCGNSGENTVWSSQSASIRDAAGHDRQCSPRVRPALSRQSQRQARSAEAARLAFILKEVRASLEVERELHLDVMPTSTIDFVILSVPPGTQLV